MGPDIVGYIASGLVLLTFTAKSMLTLRILGILSNLAFICYGIIDTITPVLCLHAILLPLNIVRLAQILACAERPQIRFHLGWRPANEAKPLGSELDDREPGRAHASSHGAVAAFSGQISRVRAAPTATRNNVSAAMFPLDRGLLFDLAGWEPSPGRPGLDDWASRQASSLKGGAQ
jgi:hypothetical protein